MSHRTAGAGALFASCRSGAHYFFALGRRPRTRYYRVCRPFRKILNALTITDSRDRVDSKRSVLSRTLSIKSWIRPKDVWSNDDFRRRQHSMVTIGRLIIISKRSKTLVCLQRLGFFFFFILSILLALNNQLQKCAVAIIVPFHEAVYWRFRTNFVLQLPVDISVLAD